MLLLDVTPLTLSIETAGGVATPMIERNTTIPKKASQLFSTYADNQTAVDIRVLQGERPMAKDNKLIGNFRLDGIAPAPRGLPQIEVTFDIDANGILNVSAKDKSTGKEQKITITNSSGLSKEEVERLRKEAELHAAEDANIKETAEARNELDNMAYGLEKQIKENGGKLPAQIKGELEEGVKKAQELLKDNNATKEALKAESEKLTKPLEQALSSPSRRARARLPKPPRTTRSTPTSRLLTTTIPKSPPNGGFAPPPAESAGGGDFVFASGPKYESMAGRLNFH